jgi:hypothetical protein
MKQSLLNFVLIIFLLINIGLMFYIKDVKKTSLTTIEYQANNINHYIELYVEQLSQAQLNNDLKINDTITVNNEFNDKRALHELFTRSPKVIIRFSELGCNLCIEEELSLIKEYVSKIGNKNIIILTNHSNVRRLLNFKISNNINFDIFSCNNIGIPFEKENRLFVFVSDSSLLIKNFFIPEKSFPKLSKEYYLTISKKYFSPI